MKKIIVIIVALVLVTFISCKLDEGFSEFNPSIFLVNPVHLNSDSTLQLKAVNLSAARIDSIHIGDTLHLLIGMDGINNALTNFEFTLNDTSAIKTSIPDSMKYVFKSLNFKTGKFQFNEKYSGVILPLNLVAVKKSDSIVYKFNVYSNVSRVSNVDEISFITKIK